MATKYKLEYIWLDGYTPMANLRSKTQIKEFASFPKLEELPNWGFDGSSTRQAEGKSSDIVLKPVAVFPDSTRKNGVLVMCETFLHTGEAHPSNSRATIAPAILSFTVVASIRPARAREYSSTCQSRPS